MAQPQTAQREKTLQKPDMTVGDILRTTRVHYEQSIEDIERVLHIKAAQLSAIESNQFNKLPGPVYAAGFIRTYSEYLGLDGDKMVSLFKSQSGTRPVKPELSKKLPATVQDSRTPNWWLLAASLMAILGIGALWMNGNTHDRSIVETVPSIPPSIRADSAPAARREQPVVADGSVAEPVTPPAAPAVAVQAAVAPPTQTAEAVAPAAPVQAPAEKRDGIILKITQNSWVEIKDKTGKAVVSRVLKAGDKYFVPARSDLFMSLGNSGGVKLEIEGAELPNLGAPGEVLRNLPLDVVALKKKFASKFSGTFANPAH